MIIKATFYHKTKLLPLSKNIIFISRSIHATRWGTIYHHRGTHVTRPIKVTMSTRHLIKTVRGQHNYLGYDELYKRYKNNNYE